ncbi:MAG: hypothetical protein Q9213_007187 [Squamulea squamosa]
MDRCSALKTVSAYVAVSYCWNRCSEYYSEDRNLLEPITILNEDSSTRQSAAPPDVLYRSVAYATGHGINAIWIDQECIDQTDAVDKENNIQQMDMIYQEFDHPIAVLEFGFETQAELDVFSSICDFGSFDFDSDQIEDLELVLDALSEDKWFERAWTLQESVSAGLSMTLLISCSGLRKPAHFGPTPEEFEISLWDFQNAMVNVRGRVEEGLAAGVWPDISSAINVSNCADVLWNYIPTNFPDYDGTPPRRDSSHRQSCNASQALTFLDDRHNTIFSDRLAILANLCNYQRRIPSTTLDSPNVSFTVCALTMAVLNGDMSLLGGYRQDDRRRGNRHIKFVWWDDLADNARSDGGLVCMNDNNDLQGNTYGFSWGPIPSACLKDITYLEEEGMLFRLKPASLSAQGLRVRGVLWTVDCKLSVPRTQRLFASRWQEELVFLRLERGLEGRHRQQSFVQEVFWSLLHEVMSSNLVDLAKTLWNFVQPAGIDPFLKSESHKVPLPYNFDAIFGERRNEPEIASEVIFAFRSLPWGLTL